jgi:hypothetical protein
MPNVVNNVNCFKKIRGLATQALLFKPLAEITWTDKGLKPLVR